MLKRKITRKVSAGEVVIGAGAPIAVQSMTKTPTTDIDATLSQIAALAEAGCDIIRIAVPTRKDTDALKMIVERSSLPVVADIHFSADRAIEAIEAGACKIRINPGNIRNAGDIERIISCASANGTAIRAGINEASIRDLHEDTPESRRVELMVAEMSSYVQNFERLGFENLVLSAKSTDVVRTILVNRAFSERFDYPIHIGLTHAGLPEDAIVPSAVAIGALLAEGIGDTVRVSMAGEPTAEIEAAHKILAALGLYDDKHPKVIVCPTCGRCMVDVVKLAGEVKAAVAHIRKPLQIAVMGCVVNGPGEAADADVAVCAGNGKGFIYARGRRKAVVEEAAILSALITEIEAL
jgi:(E)-4-hydroxy-3-methylbut-2-enyl-diphosphate synthase